MSVSKFWLSFSAAAPFEVTSLFPSGVCFRSESSSPWTGLGRLSSLLFCAAMQSDPVTVFFDTRQPSLWTSLILQGGFVRPTVGPSSASQHNLRHLRSCRPARFSAITPIHLLGCQCPRGVVCVPCGARAWVLCALWRQGCVLGALWRQGCILSALWRQGCGLGALWCQGFGPCVPCGAGCVCVARRRVHFLSVYFFEVGLVAVPFWPFICFQLSSASCPCFFRGSFELAGGGGVMALSTAQQMRAPRMDPNLLISMHCL